MELTESKVYEALGVQPESTGGSEQPAAEPAPQEEPTAPAGETGAKEQESAEPAARKAERRAADLAGDAGPAPAEDIQKPGTEPSDSGSGPERKENGTERMPGERRAERREVSPDARKEAAAARRRAEQKAAVEEAVQKAVREEKDRAKVEMAAFFKRAQLKNTITGEPITNMEEFNAWEQAFSDARLQRDLKDGKLTPEALEKVISENPAVKRAQELIAKQEESAREAEAAAAKAHVDAEILEIQKLDPSIRSVEDLLHMPRAKEFYDLVQSGNSFLNAFRLANFDLLTARAAEAARQQAQNLTRSKEHLTATVGQRGGGAVSVPPDEMRLFREMNPGASEAEIQAYYNRYKGQ